MLRQLIAVVLGSLLAIAAPLIYAEDAGLTLPAIKVVTDCGECKVGNSVIDMIMASYAETAKQKGAAVNLDDVMTITITAYSERTRAASLLLGWFSGKDMIVANYTFHDKNYRVEEGTRSAYLGIDTVAKFIGKRFVRNMLTTLTSKGKLTPGIVNEGEKANPGGEPNKE